jgi:hypothetical protein
MHCLRGRVLDLHVDRWIPFVCGGYEGKRHLHIVVGSIATFRLQLGRSRAWSVKCMVGSKEDQVIEV